MGFENFEKFYGDCREKLKDLGLPIDETNLMASIKIIDQKIKKTIRKEEEESYITAFEMGCCYNDTYPYNNIPSQKKKKVILLLLRWDVVIWICVIINTIKLKTNQFLIFYAENCLDIHWDCFNCTD